MSARGRPDLLPRRSSSANSLALAYGLLIVYASLYPFLPWRWPQGMALASVLNLPWPRYWLSFDVVANLVGYLPLGLLLFAGSVRRGDRTTQAWRRAILVPALLSYAMECSQFGLPSRVPSLADWALNASGGVLGAVLGQVLHSVGGLRRWHGLRESFFVRDSAGALTLLALWPLGLLSPTPVPLGLGQFLPRLREQLSQVLEGTPWALKVNPQDYTAALPTMAPMPPGLEALATALGLLAPCLLALSVARPGWQRLVLVAGAALFGVLGTALSTALNFGPQHVLAGFSPGTWSALGLGLCFSLLMCAFSRRACAAWGLVVLTAMMALLSEAPADPYLALSLQAWEQGRFVNMYGLAQWLGWLWPLAAMCWLLYVLSRRESPG